MNSSEWGAGPRASQYLVLGAKCNALLNGKYSPDIEDVQAVAHPGVTSSYSSQFQSRGRRHDS